MVLRIGKLRPYHSSEVKRIRHSYDTPGLRTGDIVETFDHIFEWDEDCLSIEQCERWRGSSDTTCDAALRQAFLSPSSTVGQDILRSLESASGDAGAEVDAIQRFLHEVRQEPPTGIRVSEQDVILAHEFFLDHSIQIIQALLHYSLAGGFASPRIVRTLEAVSYLVPHSRFRGNDANATSLTEAISLISRASADRTLSRLLETFQFVLDVMGCSAPAESAHNDPFTENDNFQQDHVAHQGEIAHIVPGGDGWRSAVRVRLLHGVARWRVQERWKKEGRFDNAVPISQEDLAATLAAFSTIPIWCLNKLGIQPSDSEAGAYLALWRHVGFYLGIEPKVLLRHFTSTRTADKFLATAALHLFSDDATHAPENPADAQRTILRGPTIPILVAVSNRPPLHTSLEYNIALTRYLLGPSLSAHLELPDTSLRVRLRMHAFLFVQRIPYYFARCYPRKRWLEKRRTVLREGMVRTLWWNLGLRKTTFRPRTMLRDGPAAPEESSAKDGELAPGVAEQEAVRPDPVRAKVLTKLWSEVWQEMVAVCAVTGVVAGFVAYIVFGYLIHCFWF